MNSINSTSANAQRILATAGPNLLYKLQFISILSKIFFFLFYILNNHIKLKIHNARSTLIIYKKLCI